MCINVCIVTFGHYSIVNWPMKSVIIYSGLIYWYYSNIRCNDECIDDPVAPIANRIQPAMCGQYRQYDSLINWKIFCGITSYV